MAAKGSARAKTEGEEAMLPMDEAASLLGVSRSTLYRWQREGRIRGFKMGRQWRFRRSELEMFQKASHPSAAAVNVAELDRAVETLTAETDEQQRITFSPSLPGYPATEEEKAVESAFELLLGTAIRAGATDIHIDAQRDATLARQRIDGVLHEMVRLPRESHGALVACVKVHSGLAVDQRTLFQDGRFTVQAGDREYDVRTATIPAVYGESVAMRLLDQKATLLRLDGQHGMYPEDVEKYRRALRSPVGMLVVAGPTGSGKTTILYAGLLEVCGMERNTLTIEDPVEYAFPLVTQVPVNRKAGLTFEAGLRALMRHDPDVVMVGELRTLESAEIAAQMAITGHLVMTQVHAETAAGAVTRLLDMGLEPFMLAQTLVYVSAQRLARKVCPECARPDQPELRLLSALVERARRGGYALPDSPAFVRGKGCDHCRHTGYRGRTGLYECMLVGGEVRQLTMARALAAEIEAAAVRGGMKTLAADGLRKAAERITTVEEVVRLLPEG